MEKSEENAGTSEEFFKKFLYLGGDSCLHDYIFRGGASSIYRLFPWALRQKSQGTLSELSACPDKVMNACLMLEMECRSVYNFYSYANGRGLPIPGIDELMSHSVESDCIWQEVKETGIIPEKYSEIFALAQHYRVPTHFLDWSRDPHVALWFAANGAYGRLTANKAKEDENQDQLFSVWVMNKTNVQRLNSFLSGESCARLRFVTPPYSNNPNLKAQKGILTYYPVDTRKYTPDEEGYFGKSLDELMTMTAQRLKMQNPCCDVPACKDDYFKRYDFGLNDCLEILNWLSEHDYDTCAIMPGFHSICAALRDRAELRAKLSTRSCARY